MHEEKQIAEEAWPQAVQELIELLGATSITELELVDADLRISVKRAISPASAAPSLELFSSAAKEPDNLAYVTAPLLGTFYRSPAPTVEPFIKVGDRVEQGQVVGLIEAMKIFNEIQAEVSGRLRAILVEDGAFVEADQPLLAIDTEDSEEEPI